MWKKRYNLKVWIKVKPMFFKITYYNISLTKVNTHILIAKIKLNVKLIIISLKPNLSWIIIKKNEKCRLSQHDKTKWYH